MTGTATQPRTIAGFVPQFWIINFIELLERGAFYGALSFAALYLDSLEYSGATLGLLLAMATTLPYVISVSSGPLAEKFGYKPMTVVAFVGYAAGYTLIGLFQNTTMIVVGFLFVGFGSGLFKAIPAACITHLTPESKRNLGFVIYYWMINVGAFLAPIALAYAILGPADYDLGSYKLSFYVLGVLSAAAFGVSLTFFRNPSEPARDKSIAETFSPMLDVIRDPKFTKAAGVYVGFFILYVMNFTYMTIYLNDFVALPSWFQVSTTNSINPLTIILLAVPLGALAARFHPLRMMTVGLTLFTAGFFILGFSGAFWGLVVGVVLASIGEFLTQPGFLSYISRIAPKDRVAIYQSMGFLPIAVGYFVGSFLGGPIYERVAVEGGAPELFWAIVTSVGLLTLAAFIYLAARVDADDAGLEKVPKRQKGLSLVPFMVIIAAIGIAAAMPTTDSISGITDVAEISSDLGSWSDSLEEGASWTQTVAVGGSGLVSVGLIWEDEPAQQPGGLPVPLATNEADEFQVRILDADGNELATGTSDTGALPLEWQNDGGAVEITIEVTLLSAGDHTIGGQNVGDDTGNDFELVAGLEAA